MSTHETLGLLLVRDGLITRTELYDALRLQRQNNRLLGTCLLSLGTIKPEILLEMLSRQLSIPALPPGTLKRAQPAAIQRVPAELAWRLRILPYSWDGEMLGVAFADGRVVEHLPEVAYHARCAVGAYVALELEIEEVLRGVYRDLPTAAATGDAPVTRPRPPRAEAPSEVPTVLSTVKRSPTPAKGVPVINKAPPPVPKRSDLERLGLFEAVEQIHDAVDLPAVAKLCGRALLNYFKRVAVAQYAGGTYKLVGCAGLSARRVEVPENALPLVTKRVSERNISYGPASLDVRAAEIYGVFGFDSGATALLAAVGPSEGKDRVLLFADNGDDRELYEDLHDIEMLCKEAETGLSMLKGRT